MLSILIPTYNYDVTELVVELKKQATKAEIIFEIIVVDDASFQSKIVERNEQINSIENCRYIVQHENQGRTGTRQHLAKLAKFDNLLFLDADILPKHTNFIENFEVNNTDWELKFGGIDYKQETPKAEEILRWKYGKNRESLPLSQRQQKPYLSINSGAFLMKKNIFLAINSRLDFKVYGLDNLFKQLLQNDGVKVIHIDNPVYHLGLENATHFIEKSKQALKTTFDMEKRGLINSNLRPIQKAYNKFNKYGLLRIFKFLMKVFNSSIERNLKSVNPSLTLFDLYRLSFYIDLKSQKDA